MFEQALEDTLRQRRGHLVAQLARSLGLAHLALAEDALQTAALRALADWSANGVPDNPAGWLYRVAHRAAIDILRRDSSSIHLDSDDASLVAPAPAQGGERFSGELHDDELALLFAACHPALPLPSQVALALRALCGFELGVIADGLLTTEAALAQRLARARQQLRDVTLALPAAQELPPRREAVLAALLLMFNAGWQAQARDARALCWEAIRLARAVAAHPAAAHPDADALAALLLLHGARLTGRHDAQGDIVPLPGQPRDRWDHTMVRMGFAHLARAQGASRLSRYHLQAGIAAEHAGAADYASTHWPRIVAYYEALLVLEPGAAPRLGHAIALAEGGAPAAAQQALETLLPSVPEALRPHALAALAHAHQRLGHAALAQEQLDAAIALARNEADRRLLERRRAALVQR